MNDLLEKFLLNFGSLFAIIDPIAAIPAFLAMTARDSIVQRRRMAATASGVSCLVLVAFAALGPAIFRLFGITMPAFQIAGGLILLLSALDMLRAKRSPLKETAEETAAGVDKADIAITPLAIPMLAGPGAITTAIVLATHSQDFATHAIVYGCIVLVSALCYAILWLAAGGAGWLNPIAMNVMERLMGLLLSAIGIQFILTALKLR